jgi:Co/Zn/Cd efflux system component
MTDSLQDDRDHRWQRRHSRTSSRPGQGELTQVLLMALSDGDKTFHQLLEQFSRLERRMGYFRFGELDADFVQAARHDLELLRDNGLLTEEEGVYSITAEGRERARDYLGLAARFSRLIDRGLLPETVSIVGVAVHFALAALKLGAAVVSGSIGLLSDGTDTLLDGLSSVLVFLGLKLDKERYVNVVLIVLMLGVGLSLIIEVVRRFLQPFQPRADLLSFGAAVASGVVCLLLGQYQQYVGVRSGSLSLVSQSVDSRNHVIVAVGVSAGLVATALNFGLLDVIVGLGVAVLIIKSALELAAETIRALQGEEVDLSRYEPAVLGMYREAKERRFREWTLYLVYNRGPINTTELHDLAKEALDFGAVTLLRELRMAENGRPDERLDVALGELREGGLVSGDDPIVVTSKGKQEVEYIMAKRQHAFWRGHTHV